MRRREFIAGLGGATAPALWFTGAIPTADIFGSLRSWPTSISSR
jgi:hypothetical protein